VLAEWSEEVVAGWVKAVEQALSLEGQESSVAELVDAADTLSSFDGSMLAEMEKEDFEEIGFGAGLAQTLRLEIAAAATAVSTASTNTPASAGEQEGSAAFDAATTEAAKGMLGAVFGTATGTKAPPSVPETASAPADQDKGITDLDAFQQQAGGLQVP